MGPRFALRWTAVSLLCFLVLLTIAFVLRNLAAQQTGHQQIVSIYALADAAEMPLNANGSGTQIISGTTVTLKLQPYPALSAVASTVTLSMVSPDGHPVQSTTPQFIVRQTGIAAVRTFPLTQLPGGVYTASGVLFPAAGVWNLRIDINVGDQVPAMMLVNVNATQENSTR